MRPHILITAGGTGGHFFPALACAKRFVEKGVRVTVITDQRTVFPDAEKEITFAIRRLSLPKIRTNLDYITFCLGVLYHIVPLIFWMRREKIRGVVGFGGYPSIPGLLAGLVRRTPLFVHEQNAVLGKVNRLFSRVSAGIMTTFSETVGLPPSCFPRVANVGTPVREAIMNVKRSSVFPSLNTLLILGGSQGSRAMSELVTTALIRLPPAVRKNLFVFHQARQEDLAPIVALYKREKIRAAVQPFFTNMPELFSRATVAITRCGASTLAELMVTGCPAILIPYPWAADDHQTHNAQFLARAGGVAVLSEKDNRQDRLAECLLNMLNDKKKLGEMSARLKKLAMPSATEKLVTCVMDKVIC